MKIISYIEKDPHTGLYVGLVPSIPGAHTQAQTLEELYKNLKEVVELCLRDLTPEERATLPMPEFVTLCQIEV